jgi:hypothetical protein
MSMLARWLNGSLVAIVSGIALFGSLILFIIAAFFSGLVKGLFIWSVPVLIAYGFVSWRCFASGRKYLMAAVIGGASISVVLVLSLYFRLVILAALPYPEQDHCSFDQVSEQEYQGYVEQARRRMAETRAEWKMRGRIDGENYLPQILANEIIPAQSTWGHKLAAAHGMMRAFNGVLVDGGVGQQHARLVYRIVLPGSFLVGGCITSCYDFRTVSFGKEYHPIYPRDPQIHVGSMSSSLIDAGPTEIMAAWSSAVPRCPKPE